MIRYQKPDQIYECCIFELKQTVKYKLVTGKADAKIVVFSKERI